MFALNDFNRGSEDNMRLTVIALLCLFFLSACATKGQEVYDGTDGDSSTTTGETSVGVTSGGITDITPGSEDDFIANIGDRIFFGFDKSELSGEAQDVLRQQAEWLKQYPSVVVLIEGHCDERGTRDYNIALGARRANAALAFLQAEGIDRNRMDTISYGKERPAALGSNNEAWAQNRRAVITVR